MIPAGTYVQLKEPENGRRFPGKVAKNTDEGVKVVFPTGYYVIFPEERWEILKKSTVKEEEIDEDDESEGEDA